MHRGALSGMHHDLDEAMQIALRSGLRLHEADAHLGYARLGIAEGDPMAARRHLENAREIINATGYHRRDGEVRKLESQLVSA